MMIASISNSANKLVEYTTISQAICLNENAGASHSANGLLRVLFGSTRFPASPEFFAGHQIVIAPGVDPRSASGIARSGNLPDGSWIFSVKDQGLRSTRAAITWAQSRAPFSEAIF